MEGLIQAGYHPDTHRDSLGIRAVHAAADKGHLKCLRALVDAGGTLDAAGEFGVTPLHMAVQSNQFDTAKWIVTHPVGKKCQHQGMGPEKKTPLAIAVEKKHQRIEQVLRDAGGTMELAYSSRMDTTNCPS